MNDAARESLETRLVVLAPTVKDAELTREILARAGIACVACSDQVQVCEQLTAGAGAVLIAEEAVHGDVCLAEWLGRQPPWSDLPVLILARAGANSPVVAQAMAELGNVAVLERPARVAALVSAVSTALRARQRQYQLRDQLVQRERLAEHLKMAMAAADAGSWQINLTTGECSGSDHAIELHGLLPGAPLNHERALACVHPDDRASIEAALRLTIESGKPFRHVHRVPQPDGSVRWLLFHAQRRDEGGQASVIGLVQDVTERKKAEEALAQRTELLNGVLESTTDVIFAKDLNGRLLIVNAACAALLSATPEQLTGKTGEELHPADVAAAIRQHDETVIAGGVPVQLEESIPVAGDPRVFITLKAPLRDGGGRVVGVLGISRDVTERKRAEEKLRSSEEMLRLAVRDTGILVYTTDADLRYTWIHNPQLAFRPEDLIGRRDEDLLPAEQAAPLTAIKRRVLNTGVGETGEVAVEKDGRRHVYNLVVEPLQDHTGGVVGVRAAAMDITATKQVENQLRRLAAELTDADHRKDVFLATLAHELRNPLAPIRTGLEVMRLAGSDGKVEQARIMMDRQVSQLVRLVDDLLDVSRITQGKVELRKERVELRAVIDAAVETSRPAIEQAGQELAVVVPDEPIFVDGDAIRLSQVVSNLLNNSAKYTHRGGHIRLTAGREVGTVVVSVRDDGIGIPPAMIDEVFVMFTQVDRAMEKTTGGLGIGLSLVKGLVEMHGGTVLAHSDGEGMGSEFVVRLPAVTPVVARPDDSNGQTSDVVPSALRRILVVDDNEDAADMLGQMLEMWGNEVRTANDGEAGIGVAAQFRPDVVLMDIGMPQLNGYDAARRIREYPWGRDMVLVALTGWGQNEDKRKSQEAGFDAHLVKPVDLAALNKLLGGLKISTDK